MSSRHANTHARGIVTEARARTNTCQGNLVHSGSSPCHNADIYSLLSRSLGIQSGCNLNYMSVLGR